MRVATVIFGANVLSGRSSQEFEGFDCDSIEI